MTVLRAITNDGIKELTKLHGLSAGGVAFSLVALGTCDPDNPDNAPAATDTGLNSELTTSTYTRKLATVTVDPALTGDPNGTTIMYTATWEPGEIVQAGGSAQAITEIGLFNSSGKMYYRELRGALTFDDTVGVVIKIKCKFSRVV